MSFLRTYIHNIIFIADCYKAMAIKDRNDYCFKSKKGTIFSVQRINIKFKYIKVKYGVKINKMKELNNYSNLTTDDEYTLSPNPANNEVIVKGANEIREITILDMQGKELKSFYNTDKFNISFLKNGTYIIRIKDSENKVHYQKLIKQ